MHIGPLSVSHYTAYRPELGGGVQKLQSCPLNDSECDNCRERAYADFLIIVTFIAFLLTKALPMACHYTEVKNRLYNQGRCSVSLIYDSRVTECGKN